jgi:hypothetical protein
MRAPQRPVICPACGMLHRSLQRYPRALCPSCESRVTNSAGLPLVLAREARFGGIVVETWDAHHPSHPDHDPDA